MLVALVHGEFFDTVVMLLFKNFFFVPAPAFRSMRGSWQYSSTAGQWQWQCHSGYNFKGKKSVVCGQSSDSCWQLRGSNRTDRANDEPPRLSDVYLHFLQDSLSTKD